MSTLETTEGTQQKEADLTGDLEMHSKASISEGKVLSFRDIIYTVKLDGAQSGEAPTKKILHGISGFIPSGSMMCCLGPSGSGKTSLIHIISGQIKSTANGSHVVSGKVTVDGQEMTSTQFQRISGLVTQEDVFNKALTVQETLRFAAALKLQKDDRKYRENRVEEVIKALQLGACRGTYVGDDADPMMKGISGGEKRRTAIAIELLDPSIRILVLDEPTSGLDAAAAQNVINVLSILSEKKKLTVMTTLHQPRTSIMSKFDSIMILAGGKMIFNGKRDAYVNYLTDTLKCSIPAYESPYDVLLDVLNPAIAAEGNVPEIGVIPPSYEGDVGEELAKVYSKSSIFNLLTSSLDKAISSSNSAQVESSKESFHCVTWLKQFWVLLHRTFLVKLRDPICLMTQISSAVLMGLIFGVLYWDSYDKSTNSFAILDTQMCIVMVTLMEVWLPYDVTLTFPMERRIFLRERRAGLYPTSAFYMARVSADVPAHVISAIIMAVIVHVMAGLRCDLFAFILIGIASILVGAAILQCIGAMSRTFEEANIYMMVILMMSMMLGTGFVREVPSFLGWARDISVMGIVADMAMYLEFKDIPDKYQMTSAEIFDEYGVLITNDKELWEGAMTLFWIFLVCRILCFIFVKFLFTGRSWREDIKD